MAKVYERINWEDSPSKNTPINAENLNKMDEAIDKLDDKIVELEENGGSGGSSGDYLEKENPSGTGSFSMNRKEVTETYPVGECSSVFGKDSVAAGAYSFAAGYNAYAMGDYSIAVGDGMASGFRSYAIGGVARGKWSYSEGHMQNVANGDYSHAEGSLATANGSYSHAEGRNNITNGSYSHAEGYTTLADGASSHAEGYRTTALDYQHAQGHYNNTLTAIANTNSGTSSGTAFVIGNGASGSLSNAMRVTGEGQIYAQSSTISTGADYAEYFEWVDENPNAEDRVGYFVTFDEENEEKIRIANEGDYILGIISGLPSVIGNGDEDWKQRFVTDDFGRYLTEEFEYTIEEYTVDEEGNEVAKEVAMTGTKWKENPDYDNTKEYIPRHLRSEWSAVGMLGVLSVRDDGTCKVNGYCKCSDNGIATACEKGTDTYRVIKRVSDNVVKVVLK